MGGGEQWGEVRGTSVIFAKIKIFLILQKLDCISHYPENKLGDKAWLSQGPSHKGFLQLLLSLQLSTQVFGNV